MADNKILFKIVVDDEGNVTKLKATEKGFRDIDLTVKNAQKSAELLNKTVKELGSSGNIKSIKLTNKEYESLAKTQAQLKNSTGAATSATLELGRAISDAPYGIRGVANNLSQFASQFSFMANSVDQATGKTVGFTGAIKNLGKAIRANAILLLIQAVISAFDYFSTSVSKADKQINTFYDSVSKGFVKVSKLEALKGIMEDSNSTIEQQKEALEDLKELGFDPASDSIDQFIEKQRQLVVVQAGMKAVEEELASIFKQRLELFAKMREELTTLIKIQEKGYGGEDISRAVLDQLSLDKKELDKKEKELKAQLENLIRSSLDLDIDSSSGGGRDRRPRVEALNLESASEFEKRMRKIQEESLRLLKDNFDYSEPLEIISASQIDPNIPDSIKQAILEYNKSIAREFLRITELEEFQEYSELFKNTFSEINSFLDGEFERQLTIEQNRTNALNEQLNQRLLNEQLSAERRKSIQNQIWQNDEALRKRQEAIERKKFRQQKAFNISVATIDTFRAAAGVLADTKGGSFARIAGMATVITSGLAQVAAIARQQFQSSSANTPIRTGATGGDGGVGDRSFNFTLAGQTEGNQIVDAIQSQFSNPIRAYVVSGDVTNQQQLDANIQSSASF